MKKHIVYKKKKYLIKPEIKIFYITEKNHGSSNMLYCYTHLISVNQCYYNRRHIYSECKIVYKGSRPEL